MTGPRRAAVIFGITLCGASACLGAADRVQVAQPAPWVDSVEKPDFSAPTSADAKKGFDILLAEDQFAVEEQSRYTRLTYRITSALGVQNGSNVTVTYDPEYESIDFHQLHIIRDGQVLDRLDLGKIKSIQQEKDLERYQYNGQLTALILLDDIRVGDIVDYAYTRRGGNPVLAGHFCAESLLTRAIPVHRERIRLLFNQDNKVYFKVMGNGSVACDPSTHGNLVEYNWHADRIPAVELDEELPAGYEPYSYLQFSDFPDWHGVAAWAQPLYKLPDPLPASVVDRALKVAGRSISEEQKVLAVLHFVQEEIRYLGIEMGAHSHRPNPPELVLERRYGDCKDKVMLLCAMLKALGVRAAPALTHSDQHGAIAGHEPTPSAFNHVIAWVEAEGIDYWVDPTLTDQEGDLPHRSIPPYTWALPVRDAVNVLYPVEVSKDARSSVDVREVYSLGPSGTPATLVVRSTYYGAWADSMRGYLKHATVEQVTKENVNFRSRVYPRIRVVSPPSWVDADEANTITMTTTYAIDDIWQTPEGTKLQRAEFYPMTMRDYIMAPASPNRSMPMYLQYPLDIRYEADITSPWNGTVSIPDKSIILGGYLRATASYNGSSHMTVLKYALAHDLDQIPASKVAEYADKLREFRQAVSYSLTIDPEAVERGKHFRLSWTFTAVLLLAVALSTFGVWLVYRIPRADPALAATANPELSGLEGWLVLVGIGTVLRPVFLLFQIIKLFHNMIDGRVWDALTSPSSTLYKPGFAPIAIAEAFSNTALVSMSLLMVVLFFQRRRTYPMTFVVYWVATLVVLVADHVLAIGVLHSGTAATDAKFGTQLFQAMVAASIWIPYMLVSKRVRATFVT